MTIDHVVRLLQLLVKNMYLARNEQYLIKGFLKHRFPLWFHGLRLAGLDNFPASHLVRCWLEINHLEFSQMLGKLPILYMHYALNCTAAVSSGDYG